MGAEMTAFGGAAAVADETDVAASLRGEGATVAKVRQVVAFLGELGCKTADPFGCAVDAAELAGALCAAVDRPERLAASSWTRRPRRCRSSA